MIMESLSQMEIDKLRIRPTDSVIMEPSILKIGNVPYGTLGNFSCIHGKPKSKKTFLVTLLISSLLKKESIDNLITSNLVNSKVIHFDTEQSRHHVNVVTKRVEHLSERDDLDDRYYCYALRELSTTERMNFIISAISNTQEIGVVIIDGIADLVNAYNDEKEASTVVNTLMQLSSKYNIHIITVLHQNKGDNNAKGHLGSLLLQKAETVLSVTSNKTGSYVSPTHSRGVNIEKFCFDVNDDGLPYIKDVVSVKAEENEIRSPSELGRNKHIDILTKSFGNKEPISRTPLMRSIRQNLKDIGIEVGIVNSRKWLDFYKDNNYVYQQVKQGAYYLNTEIG